MSSKLPMAQSDHSGEELGELTSTTIPVATKELADAVESMDSEDFDKVCHIVMHTIVVARREEKRLKAEVVQREMTIKHLRAQLQQWRMMLQVTTDEMYAAEIEAIKKTPTLLPLLAQYEEAEKDDVDTAALKEENDLLKSQQQVSDMNLKFNTSNWMTAIDALKENILKTYPPDEPDTNA